MPQPQRMTDPIALPAASFVFDDLGARITAALSVRDFYTYNRVFGGVVDAIAFAHGYTPQQRYFASVTQHWGDTTPLFGKG